MTRVTSDVDVLNDLFSAGVVAIFGDVDALKLRSCLTLFLAVAPADTDLLASLDRFYDGVPDPLTTTALGN